MIQLLSSVWALLPGIVLIMLGNGMHFTLIGLRGGIEGFSAAELAVRKSAGFIRGYRGVIALDRIGDFTQVIVTVALAHHRKSDFDRFETHIRKLDAVTECIATGGGMDYVMKIVSPSLAAFQDLMESLLAAELGIQRYMTYIVTREVKSEPPNLAALTARTGN